MPLCDADCAATYKILILGDASVGKTALLRRLAGKDFQERTLPTIATDFIRIKFEVDGALVELQIWDTAGEERFRSVTRWQYRNVMGVAMVYDVTDMTSFRNLSFWLQSVNEEIAHKHNKYEAVPMVLLGNKCDLDTDKQVDREEARKFAEKELAFDFMETSAMTGENVFAAFRKLAHHVTEICNPDVMKSYHPNMIREPKFLAVFNNNGDSVPISGPVVKANMARNHVTIEWPTRNGQVPKVKLKRKKKRKCAKCCH